MSPRKPKKPAKKTTTRPKIGRPSKFDEAMLGTVTRLARLGATDPEMAEALEVGTATITRWMKTQRAFRLAYKEGKVEADMRVADSLFNRTQFHEYKKTIPFKVKRVEYENGKRVREIEEVVEKEVTEVLPPDTTAIIYWLNNRRKNEWRTRKELVLSDAELDGMTDEQLEALAQGKLPQGVR
jgi:hypothetical protein